MLRINLFIVFISIVSLVYSYQVSSRSNHLFLNSKLSNLYRKNYFPDLSNSHSNSNRDNTNFILSVSLSADPFSGSGFGSRVRRSSSSSSSSSASTVVQKEASSSVSSAVSSSTPSSLNEQNNDQTWDIDLLYDSKCPICMMEVEFLRKRDINHKIRFTDLQSMDYNPADHGNVEFAEGMRKIRAVLPDQTVVMGVEVFRQTYEAIGLGWIFSLTKLPIIGYIADRIYDIWAENRLRITGRQELAEELKERAEILRTLEFDECNSDACGIDYDSL